MSMQKQYTMQPSIKMGGGLQIFPSLLKQKKNVVNDKKYSVNPTPAVSRGDRMAVLKLYLQMIKSRFGDKTPHEPQSLILSHKSAIDNPVVTLSIYIVTFIIIIIITNIV